MKKSLYPVKIFFISLVKLSVESLKSWFDPGKDITALYEKETTAFKRPDKENRSLPFFSKKWGYR